MTTSDMPPEDPAAASAPPPSPPGTLSPDGRWVWNGQQWQPAPPPPPPGSPPQGYGYPPAQAPYPGYGAPPPGYGMPPPGYPGAGYPGYPVRAIGPAPGVAYATFLQRVGAAILDGIIFVVLTIIFLIVIGVSAGSEGTPSNNAGVAIGVIGLILTFLAACVYQIVLPAQGGTYGMRALHLRVARADNGANIGLPLAFGRWAVMVAISFVPFGSFLDVLWMLWDERRQTLHDKAVNTFVVTPVG
ncbi:MAG TPA: RDD family protein [Candidatus Dormibacteraeota bacterium]